MIDEVPTRKMAGMRARDIMKRDVKKVKSIERVRVVFDLIKNTTHNGFPVVKFQLNSDRAAFAGLVQRTTLVRLLQSKAFYRNPEQASPNSAPPVATL